MKNLFGQFHFKKIYYAAFPILIVALLLYSCSAENSGKPTATDFKALHEEALNSITETFHFDGAAGSVYFTTIKGVEISLNTFAVTLNGNPVTGQIDLKVIEIFDGANMLSTGMHTMGKMPDGNHAVMNSGGEFYINATKDGQQLELNGNIGVQIPTSLTDNVGGNPDMTLWKITEADTAWVQQADQQIGQGGVIIGGAPNGVEEGSYYAYFDHFGWTNVDCFYSDPRPKTTILASVPNGYNNQNSAIYLHYDGQGNALANLDTYDSATKLFSEHYGQIPIGLVCHVIFVTEDNGQWRYAIKATTIAAGDVYNFTMAETTVGTKTEMVAAISALP